MLKSVLPLLAAALLLIGCGGDDDPPAPPPPPPAPTGLSYPTPPAFTVGVAITPLSPTVTGTVSSYSIAPALPDGLVISATTGVVSGTPTARSAVTRYVVTAGNASGTTTTTFDIAVFPAPAISYENSPYVLAVGTAATITPTITGAVPTSWSVDHALPAGLALNATSGVISGTPTTSAASANYIVTAATPGGNLTSTLALAVNVAAPDIQYFRSTRTASSQAFPSISSRPIRAARP